MAVSSVALAAYVDGPAASLRYLYLRQFGFVTECDCLPYFLSVSPKSYIISTHFTAILMAVPHMVCWAAPGHCLWFAT